MGRRSVTVDTFNAERYSLHRNKLGRTTTDDRDCTFSDDPWLEEQPTTQRTEIHDRQTTQPQRTEAKGERESACMSG